MPPALEGAGVFGLGALRMGQQAKVAETWLQWVVLSVSRKDYREAVLRQDGGIYLRVLENAVRYFGGVFLRLGTSKEDGLRRWTNSTK